jgi:hypothetical protein
MLAVAGWLWAADPRPGAGQIRPELEAWQSGNRCDDGDLTREMTELIEKIKTNE